MVATLRSPSRSLSQRVGDGAAAESGAADAAPRLMRSAAKRARSMARRRFDKGGIRLRIPAGRPGGGRPECGNGAAYGTCRDDTDAAHPLTAPPPEIRGRNGRN